MRVAVATVMTHSTRDTPAWIFQAWASFLISVGASALGIYHLPCDIWSKAFVALAYFFTVAASFTLSKTIRDNHEQERIASRLKKERAEQAYREYVAPEAT